eukprot:m.57490 g.57490  ORF g.57490 m.57490 type:complete len:124 (+) comp22392_c0_seq1:150-521(+)
MDDEETKNTYKIRPEYHAKFKQVMVQETIQNVLKFHLENKQYDSEKALEWSQTISDDVKDKIKEMNLDRYKVIVQCVIGEQRGGGAKVACKCLWDSDTDNYAQHVFTNESLFCVTAAYGVYYY